MKIDINYGKSPDYKENRETIVMAHDMTGALKHLLKDTEECLRVLKIELEWVREYLHFAGVDLDIKELLEQAQKSDIDKNGEKWANTISYAYMKMIVDRRFDNGIREVMHMHGVDRCFFSIGIVNSNMIIEAENRFKTDVIEDLLIEFMIDLPYVYCFLLAMEKYPELRVMLYTTSETYDIIESRHV